MRRTLNEGINQGRIQEINKALVLKLIREQGVCSRAQLSQLSGLNKATITYIVNDFIENKCVEETGLISNKKGRRSIGLMLSDKKYYVIGIRLARTYYKIGMFNLRGELEQERRIEVEKEVDYYKVLDNITENIMTIIKKNNHKELLIIGMAVPGPFIKSKGKIAVLTGKRSYEGIEFKTELEKRIDTDIIVEHDANAGAFAQLWFDKGIDKRKSLIYVAAGEGIGSGIVMNGSIVQGETGIAGEIGHTTINFNGEKCECGNRGCLEKYCSLLALRKNIAQMKKREYQLSEIKALVEKGDPEVVSAYKSACRFLGYGIVNVINSYDPTVVVLGDELSHINSDIILEEVDHVLEDRLLDEIYRNLNIKVSQIVNDSVLHGIGAMCLEQAFNNYFQYFENKCNDVVSTS